MSESIATVVERDLPHANESALTPPSDEEGQRKLLEAEAEMDKALGLLTTGAPAKIPWLTFNVQRWRVAVMVLRERAEGKVDPKIYNEMSLLSRMAKNVDFDEDVDQAEAERARTAAEKLQEAGVSVQGARAVIEMFTRTQADAKIPQSDPDPPAGRD